MPFISFCKINDARTGNILFQYLICKQIGLQYGHTYIPYEEIGVISPTDTLYATDHNIHELLSVSDDNKDRLLSVSDDNKDRLLSVSDHNKDRLLSVSDHNKDRLLTDHNTQLQDIRQKNIICNGFFQKSEYYIKDREPLLNILYNTDDYWIYKNKKEYIKDFLYSSHSLQLQPNDLVISLRLDDFIQMPCPTSDIIPPQYYMNILETKRTTYSKVYIVCDTIRHDWERKYLEFFQKWNPILLQKDLMHDCALIRECPYLIHSNSTLCWFMSFVANHPKIRYIPKTHFYSVQSLNEIESTDQLTNVSPMIHHNVYWLNLHNWLIENSIFPLSYCIPDECICSDEDALKNKHIVLADLIPGEPFTYRYGHDQEEEYNQSYRESRFAISHKKGGWECLRHYEIMANGCIPVFKNLQHCPPLTLTTFPKELVINANRELLPWKKEYTEKYNDYVRKMLAHVRTRCSTSATVDYFLSKMVPQINQMQNVLLIMGNCGVNYTRETFWIGLKRYIQSRNGVAVEYPKMDFLYDTYTGNKKGLYGNGFTYSSRLKDDYQLTKEDIVQKIDTHFWDLIVYGKVGPDELVEGSHPNMPLWDHVFKQYGKHEIVFLYGGDECIDLSYENRYRQHILYHSQYANCFVREYKIK